MRLDTSDDDDDSWFLATTATTTSASAAAAAAGGRGAGAGEASSSIASHHSTTTTTTTTTTASTSTSTSTASTRTLLHVRIGADRVMRVVLIVSAPYRAWFDAAWLVDHVVHALRRVIPAKLRREADAKVDKQCADVCIVGDALRLGYCLRPTDAPHHLLRRKKIKNDDDHHDGGGEGDTAVDPDGMTTTYHYGESYVVHALTMVVVAEPAPHRSRQRAYGSLGDAALKRPGENWLKYGRKVVEERIEAPPPPTSASEKKQVLMTTMKTMTTTTNTTTMVSSNISASAAKWY